MPPPICTLDASSAIALDHLDLLPQLSFLFARVLLPKAVRSELSRRRATKNRLRALIDNYGFVERCDNYDKAAVDILLIERASTGKRDRGEAEAVVQASQVGAVVIVDDRWGRTLASRFGRERHGKFWVLQRLFDLGLISASAVRTHFVHLRERGIRLPWGAVDRWLHRIGEEPLSHAAGS